MSDDLKELKNFDFYLAKTKKRKQRKKAKQFQSRSYLKTATRVKSFFFSHARAYRTHNFFLFGHGFSVSWPLRFEIHFAGQELTHILVMKQIHMTLERVGWRLCVLKKAFCFCFKQFSIVRISQGFSVRDIFYLKIHSVFPNVEFFYWKVCFKFMQL